MSQGIPAHPLTELRRWCYTCQTTTAGTWSNQYGRWRYRCDLCGLDTHLAPAMIGDRP